MEQALKQPDFDISFFQSKEFLAHTEENFHGFFGRQGGVSKGVYDSLNCGRGSDDNLSNVQINLDRVAQAVGVASENLLTMHQIHSDKSQIVEEPWTLEQRPEIDSMVTDKAGIALGVLTADCAPVLFLGFKKDGAPVIGAAHAGWKGAVGGVLDSTIENMKNLGAEDIKACIGPCIAQASYEVSEDFFKPFEKDDPENERFFMAGAREGHLMFDLAGYCASRLARQGLKHVFIKDLDTYFNEEDFFSYRRATHRKEKDYGRQISVIMIKK